MYYKYIEPSEILSPYVKHYWVLEINASEGEVSERVIPTDSVQLMFHYKNPFFEKNTDGNIFQPCSLISGLSNSYTDVSSSGDSGVIAVVFHPFGACNFFNFSLHEISNKSIDLTDLDNFNIRLLEEKLHLSLSLKEKISVIEKYLIDKLNPIASYDLSILQKCISVINTNKFLTTSELSEMLCITNKTLERKFSRFIGITPKQFIRIIRFQESIRYISDNSDSKLTDTAYEYGFFDQAHFIKDFKDLSGYTPKRFLEKCIYKPQP